MEKDGAQRKQLILRVQEHLRTGQGRELLTALIRAHENGGSRAVKALITGTLNEEKEVREGDGDRDGHDS